MTAIADCCTSPRMTVPPQLLEAIAGSVESAMPMCGMSVRCVGVSQVPLTDVGSITGVIGVHGSVSGFIHANMSEQFAIRAVEGLIDGKFDKLCSQVVDGAGEITNLIVGGIKSSLGGTPWAFSQITVPSVLVGNGYSVSYARGLEFLSVLFESQDPEAVTVADRLMQVSISLLRK